MHRLQTMASTQAAPIRTPQIPGAGMIIRHRRPKTAAPGIHFAIAPSAEAALKSAGASGGWQTGKRLMRAGR